MRSRVALTVTDGRTSLLAPGGDVDRDPFESARRARLTADSSDRRRSRESARRRRPLQTGAARRERLRAVGMGD